LKANLPVAIKDQLKQKASSKIEVDLNVIAIYYPHFRLELPLCFKQVNENEEQCLSTGQIRTSGL
jgi:hypothetical protein